MPQPLLENLEMLLKVSTTPITLHYDTVFNMGDFYLSTLVFRHSLFEKDPITPVAYFIHSRRYHDTRSHEIYADSEAVITSILAAKRILMVTDREFDFSEIFP